MPHMAIATGQVDFVLPPEEIATTLANLSHHPYLSRPATPSPAATATVSEADTLAAIFDLLKTTSRVDFSQYKSPALNRRILRRMALHHIEAMDCYRQYLQENPAEVQALYQEILISVTGFFGDAGAFEALQQEVFPDRLRDRPADLPWRIWVAGCSTGEEAYSMAICLLEFLAHQPARPSKFLPPMSMIGPSKPLGWAFTGPTKWLKYRRSGYSAFLYRWQGATKLADQCESSVCLPGKT